MDKQQYENMQKVMAISRIFCDRMRKFMDDCGLLEQGFQFEIDIHNAKYGDDDDGNFLASVELSKSITKVDIDEYHATKFNQWKYEKRGWMVHDDPLAKAATLPDDTDVSDLPFGIYDKGTQDRTGETATDAFGSGDIVLWFRDDGGDPPMVCRGDLNDDLAESDPGV